MSDKTINLSIVSGFMAFLWGVILIAMVALYFSTGADEQGLATLIAAVGFIAVINMLILLAICLWDRFRP